MVITDAAEAEAALRRENAELRALLTRIANGYTPQQALLAENAALRAACDAGHRWWTYDRTDPAAEYDLWQHWCRAMATAGYPIRAENL